MLRGFATWRARVTSCLYPVSDIFTCLAAPARLGTLPSYWMSFDGAPTQTWFDFNIYTLDRDMPSLGEKMPDNLKRTICVEGFDSSLEIGMEIVLWLTLAPDHLASSCHLINYSLQIRCMLEGRFGNSAVKKVVTPVNLDGTSTGKAYQTFSGWGSYYNAVKLDAGRSEHSQVAYAVHRKDSAVFNDESDGEALAYDI